MRTSTVYPARHPAIANIHSLQEGQGCRIDPTLLDDTYRSGNETVKLNGAVAAGAVSLTVDALPIGLNINQFLKFGTYAPVTVTLADASVSAGDTSITVAALSGPIPAGTALNFTGGTNAQVAQLSAAAIAGATTLTIYPIDGTIANTQTALFPGGTIGARVTVAADKAATTVAVDELQFAIADNAEAVVPGLIPGPKQIAALTAMVYVSGGNGLAVPRALGSGEPAAFLLASEYVEDSRGAGYTGYGGYVAGDFFGNLLPDAVAGVFPTLYKTELEANAGRFLFSTYRDSRAD